MAERRAVVIGINTYEDPDVKPALNGAENDAREIFARLKKFGDFNVDRDRHLLLNENATCDNIRQAISDLFWKKDPCDVAVLYFSGHGFLDDYGNGYIAPWDHIYADPLVRGIRMQELREYFLAKNNKTGALLILDCCHSGVTAEIRPQKGGTTEMPGRLYESLTGEQAKSLGSGKFILASSGANEKSREMRCRHKLRSLDKKTDDIAFEDFEEHDHGVMTYFLLEGMSGDAAEDDEVRIGTLYDHVQNQMSLYRENHPDVKTFDSVCSMFEAGPASRTMLVRASTHDELNQLVQQASELLQELRTDCEPMVVDPTSFFLGIANVDKALEVSPHNPKTHELIALAEQTLRAYQPLLENWRTGIKAQEWQRYPYGQMYRRLEALDELTFEKVRSLDQQMRNALRYMIRLALGDSVRTDFANILKQQSPGKPEVQNTLLVAVPIAGANARHA
jgi:hypothetical protein